MKLKPATTLQKPGVKHTCVNRIAIIDIGTNTFNLVIAEKNSSGKIVFVHQKELPVELGRGGIHKALITPDAFDRAIKALLSHRLIIDKYEPVEFYAFATSAVRDAANSKDFTERIRIETGVEIKVISGDEEAHWIYEGVKHASLLSKRTSIIMDIGGGSTEFIIGNDKGIYWKQSYPLGVSRLFEIFQPENPISAKNKKDVEEYCLNALSDFFSAAERYNPLELIGSSGSFESFAQMLICREGKKSVPKNGFNIKLTGFENLYNDILASTLEQRLKMRGLLKMRANAFGFSVMLTKLVLDKLSIPKMTLSLYSLKEGIAGYMLGMKE